MNDDRSTEVFFALARAGLWESDVRLLPFGIIDFSRVQSLAEEQSVVGLVAAGIEQVSDIKIAKRDVIQFICQSLKTEQRNSTMNSFIANIVKKMRNAGICTLLVKGQGVAQCYERPLWRSSGDIDFLLDDSNYIKAIEFLKPLASRAELQDKRNKGYGFTIDSHVIELHGTLRCGLSRAMDKEIDAIQEDVFINNRVRRWDNDGVEVLIPAPNDDVFFVFTHIIKHFYKGGIGLRQICDWSRLIWRYRDEMDNHLLISRLKRLKRV